MISILHDEICKRNDKKTYQVSKHHTNGLEDSSMLAHQILSRKIIKFITKKSLMSREDVDSNRFIENVKYYVERYRTENVDNSD